MLSHGLILLAAGRSTRMGGAKAWLEVEPGMPLIAWQLRQFRAASVGPCVVVLAEAPESAQRAVLGGAASVLNPEGGRGPFSSLQLGLGAWRGEGGVFVLPVDVPVADSALYRALAAALSSEAAVVLPRYEGRGGHPVLLSAKFAAWLRGVALTAEDARLDRQIQALPASAVVRVEAAGPSVLANLNDRDAWDAYFQRGPA